MKLTAPYNFVPLNKRVFCPDWSDKVSMDVPFSDGEDGIIEVEIENISPLFTRNGTAQTTKDKNEYSSHIVGENGEKRYFIPGTTLKGMFRNVMEIMSFGKLDRYNDDFFGYRNFDTKTPNKDYTDRMTNAQAGWLKKKGDDYYLVPCPFKYERIKHAELKKIQNKFDKGASVPENEKAFKGKLRSVKDGYQLVFTGPIHNKKHEYLFPLLADESYSFANESIKLSKKVKEAFLTVHKPSPLWETHFYPRLKSEKEAIPVFFTMSGNDVHSLGFSRMYRLPYKHRVSDGINQTMCGTRDLCDTIWGYINNNNSLRGRVQVGHAFATTTITELAKQSGVLSAPNASYYPLYLRPKQKGCYSTYDSDSVEISGWKRYRVHKNGVVSLPQGNGNESVMSSFYALPSNTHFTLKIAVHNLRPIEIGALISAITMHECSDVWHNLGLAKGYGYGKVICKITALNNLKKNVKEYLSLFEEAMTIFVHQEKIGETWSKTSQIQMLMNIASKHEATNLAVMKLEDKAFEHFKKDTNFAVLEENDIPITSYCNFDDLLATIEQNNLNKMMNDLEIAKRSENLAEIIRLCNYLIDNFPSADILTLNELKKITRKKEYATEFNELELAIEGNECNKVVNICKSLEQKLYDVDISDIVALRLKFEELKEIEKQAQGLSILEERTSQGLYKVKDFHKQVRKEVEKYIKKNNVTQIPENQIPILATTLKRIYSSITKEKDKLNWQKVGEGVWKDVEIWIGKEMMINLFNDIVK